MDNNVTPADTGEVIRGLNEVMRRLQANGMLKRVSEETLRAELKRRQETTG